MSDDHKLGKTGDFPFGKIDESDEGALNFGVAFDPAKGVVRIEFGTPVVWLAMLPSQAIAFANMLLAKAAEGS